MQEQELAAGLATLLRFAVDHPMWIYSLGWLVFASGLVVGVRMAQVETHPVALFVAILLWPIVAPVGIILKVLAWFTAPGPPVWRKATVKKKETIEVPRSALNGVIERLTWSREELRGRTGRLKDLLVEEGLSEESRRGIMSALTETQSALAVVDIALEALASASESDSWRG